MCGRTTLFLAQADLDDHFGATVVTDGGSTRFRRATETPTSLVFEAKP